jgi:hypothetical protein
VSAASVTRLPSPPEGRAAAGESTPRPPQVLPSAAWTGALVRAGLARFAVQGPIDTGQSADPLAAALLAEAEALAGGRLPADWPTLTRALETAWPLTEGRLGELIADLGLDPAGLFLVALAGVVEESHLATLLLDRLQSPTGGARPRVHLALAAVGELFPGAGLDVHRLQSAEAVRRGVLALDGDGPLPLRVLRMHPVLWSALNGHPALWPGCAPLDGAWARGGRTGRDHRPADGVASEPESHEPLPAAALAQAPKLADLLTRGDARCLVLRGAPGGGRARFGAVIARAAGLGALEVPVALWEQEPALAMACRYGGRLPLLRPRLGPGELWEPPARPGAGPLLVLLGADGAVAGGGLLEIALPVPNEAERRALWTRALGGAGEGSGVEEEAEADPAPDLAPADANLAGRAAVALLGGPAIASLAARARLLADRAGESLADAHVAEARRLLGAEGLRLLAQPVERRVTDEALVVPPQVAEELRAVLVRARARERVAEGLGATVRATPSTGVRLLLVGESGTGKTLIASWLATALGAPLYRVDLAAVMNKYIGESEKNLSALLDQAAAHDVVLLFDEADSLFGRRTDRKETGERYANMLTNFLLTRIETHPGVVVLATNSRERIDTAFTRRLDQILEVPLPGFEERLGLWRSHLGERGPGETVCRALAGYCDLAGGQIRNAVLTASALAAGGPIGLFELLAALRGEYRKTGRPLPAQVERLGQAP